MQVVSAAPHRAAPRSFARSVLTVAGGTAIGQGVLVAASPVLTRLYGPQEFGTLAAYMAIVAVVGGIGSLRYELAVVMADDEEQAAGVVGLCLLLVALTTLVTGVVLGVGSDAIAGWVSAPQLASSMWIVALGTGVLGVQQVLTAWSSRASAYRTLGLAKAGDGVTKAVGQVGLGFASFGSVGLLVGDVLGRVVGTAMLLAGGWRAALRSLGRVRWSMIVAMAARYRDFPRWSTPGVLMNSAGLQAPALLLASFWGLEVAGVFALGQRVIAMPMALLGQAAAQVHLGHAGRLAREDPRALQRQFARATWQLVGLGAVPIVGLALVGPWLFGLVFGPEWTEAGVYVRIFAIAFALQFVVAPLSSTLNVLEHQRWQVAWDFGRLVAVVGSMLACARMNVDARSAIAVYAVVASIAYVVLHGLGWIAIRRRVAHA